MSIEEIIESGATVTLVVTSQDLKAFATSVVKLTKRELQMEIGKELGEIFFTSEQVIAKFNIDPSTLWRWGESGYLQPVKIGRMNRYLKSDVDAIALTRVKKR